MQKTYDADKKGELLYSFYHNLFNGVDFTVPSWIFMRWHPRVLLQLPAISGTLVRLVALGFGKGKSCADDHIVFEMLYELGHDFYDMLAEAFRFRLLNHWTEDDDKSWAINIITLLEKKAGATFVKEFRPITVLSCMYRLYSKLLLRLCGDSVHRTLAPQFAFKANHQAEEVIFIWRSLIEKAIEWNIPIFGLDGDVYKAYDSTSHSLVITGLREKGVHDVLIAAWIREIRKSASKIRLGSETTSEGVFRTRSLFQGDPAAPTIFNCALDVVAGKFHSVCQSRQWGVRIAGNFYLGIICYADNYWLFATSRCMLEDMLGEWLNSLEKVEFHTPHSELTWCTTAPDDLQMSVQWQGLPIKRSSRKHGFKVLGAVVSFDGKCEQELQLRIAKSWKAFHANRLILCCKELSLRRRLSYLETLVSSVLFWAAGSWKLTLRQRQCLRGVQQNMLRKMIGLRSLTGDTVEDYCRRANCRIRQLLTQHSVRRWDVRQLSIYYAWMGRLARMQPDKVSYIILRHMDLKYIKHLQAEFGHQTHGRRLHVWRLEQQLFDYDPDWMALALSRDSWKKSMETWLETCS